MTISKETQKLLSKQELIMDGLRKKGYKLYQPNNPFLPIKMGFNTSYVSIPAIIDEKSFPIILWDSKSRKQINVRDWNELVELSGVLQDLDMQEYYRTGRRKYARFSTKKKNSKHYRDIVLSQNSKVYLEYDKIDFIRKFKNLFGRPKQAIRYYFKTENNLFCSFDNLDHCPCCNGTNRKTSQKKQYWTCTECYQKVWKPNTKR